jgi:UDP-3-O-[3-hydroxymyristoyl] N-acetylglucosamine deacetylase
MDGSAGPYAELLVEAGLRSLPWPRAYLMVQRSVELRQGCQWMRVSPGRLRISYSIDFPHPLIRRQRYSLSLGTESFRREIAPARTFGFLKEVQYLQSQGLALGGSLDNALVLDEAGLLNHGGLRFPEEFVRHKILDAVGDLALLGLPLVGRVEINRGSHDFHLKFIRHLMEERAAWRLWVPPIHNREMRQRWVPAPVWEGVPA